MYDPCLISKRRKNQANALIRKTEGKLIGAKQCLEKDKCNLNLQRHLQNKCKLHDSNYEILVNNAPWMLEKLRKFHTNQTDLSNYFHMVMNKMTQSQQIMDYIMTNNDLNRAVRMIPKKDEGNNEGKQNATHIDTKQKEFNSTHYAEKDTAEEIEHGKEDKNMTQSQQILDYIRTNDNLNRAVRIIPKKPKKDEGNKNVTHINTKQKELSSTWYAEKGTTEIEHEKEDKMSEKDTFKPDLKGAQVPVLNFTEKSELEPVERSKKKLNCLLYFDKNTETTEGPDNGIFHKDHGCSPCMVESTIGCIDQSVCPGLDTFDVHRLLPTFLYHPTTIFSQTYTVGMVSGERETASQSVVSVKNSVNDSNDDAAFVVSDLTANNLHSSRTHQSCTLGIPSWIFTTYDRPCPSTRPTTEILKNSATNYDTFVNDRFDVGLRVSSDTDLDKSKFSTIHLQPTSRNQLKSLSYHNYAQRQNLKVPTGTIIPIYDAKNDRKESEMQKYISSVKHSAHLLFYDMNDKNLENDEMELPTVSEYLVNNSDHKAIRSTIHLRDFLMSTSCHLPNNRNVCHHKPVMITMHGSMSQIPAREQKMQSLSYHSLKYKRMLLPEALSDDINLPYFQFSGPDNVKCEYRKHDDYTYLGEISTYSDPSSLELFGLESAWRRLHTSISRHEHLDNLCSLELPGYETPEFQHHLFECNPDELIPRQPHVDKSKGSDRFDNIRYGERSWQALVPISINSSPFKLLGTENVKIEYCIPDNDDCKSTEGMSINSVSYSLERSGSETGWVGFQEGNAKYKQFDNFCSLELFGSGVRHLSERIPEENTPYTSLVDERKRSDRLRYGQSSLPAVVPADINSYSLKFFGLENLIIGSCFPGFELESRSSLFKNAKYDPIPLGDKSTDKTFCSLELFGFEGRWGVCKASNSKYEEDDDLCSLELFGSSLHKFHYYLPECVPDEHTPCHSLIDKRKESDRFDTRYVRRSLPAVVSADINSTSLKFFGPGIQNIGSCVPRDQFESQNLLFQNVNYNFIPSVGISTDRTPFSLELFGSGLGRCQAGYTKQFDLCSLELFGSGVHKFQPHLPDCIPNELPSRHFYVNGRKGDNIFDNFKFGRSLLSASAVVTQDTNLPSSKLFRPENLKIETRSSASKDAKYDCKSLRKISAQITPYSLEHIEDGRGSTESQADIIKCDHFDDLCSLELFGSGTHEPQHHFPECFLYERYPHVDKRNESNSYFTFELYGSKKHYADVDLSCDGSVKENKTASRHLNQSSFQSSNRNVTVNEANYHNPCNNPDENLNVNAEENNSRDGDSFVVESNRRHTDEPFQSEMRYRSVLDRYQGHTHGYIPRGCQTQNSTELFFNDDRFSLHTQDGATFSGNLLFEISPIDLHLNGSSVDTLNNVPRNENPSPPAILQENGFDEQIIRDTLLQECISKVTGGDRRLVIDFLKAEREKQIKSTPCGVILNRILQSCIENGTLKYTKKAHEREWKGGFGTVQVCETVYHSNDRNLSYFKFIRKKIRRSRFNEEEILVNMDHGNNIPGLLSFYGVIIEDDNYISVLQEYFPGETLHHFIEHSAADLTVDTITDIVFQLLKTISTLHNKEIVHWDIKGSNIMIGRENGNRLAVRVIDLGSAKMLKHLANIKDLRNGTFVNNPPEWKKTHCDPLLRNERIMKAQDSWCLGLVLYCLLQKATTHICNYKIMGSRFGKNNIEEFVANEGYRIYDQINTIDQTSDQRLPSAVHLLSLLLECEPYKRITVTQALDHPLFADKRKCDIPTILNDLETNVSAYHNNIALSQGNGTNLSMDLFTGNHFKKTTILYEGKYLYIHYFKGESIRIQEILRDELFIKQVEKAIPRILRNRGYCLYDSKGRTVFRINEDCELNLAITIY